MTAELRSSHYEAFIDKLRSIVEHDTFQRLIIGLIVLNAITIGLETSETVTSQVGWLLGAFEALVLTIFVCEILAKILVYGWRFFTNPWNLFDFAIVSVALIPAAEGLSVLRALRILRALRLLSVVPEMRKVVQAFLSAIPAMASVIALMGLIFYVAAVVATKLFGGPFDAWFGTIGRSLYTLFQVMTLESWSMGIVRPVMQVYPYAWMFFVPFILVSTFAVLNLFIAIIVNSMHSATEDEEQHQILEEQQELIKEVRELRNEIAALKTKLVK